MIQAPPLSHFCGWIKQLDSSALERNEEAALDLAFPLFRELDDRLLFGNGTAGHTVITGLGSKVLYVGRGRERRYAGDRSLPRSRYWSLCFGPSGFDGGTVAHEMRAYFSYTSRCAVDFFDTTTEHQRIAEADSAGRFSIARVRDLTRSFFGSEDHPCMILLISPHQMTDKARTAGLQVGNVNVFLFPLIVAGVSVRSVFDLRLPSAQEWLWQSFLPLEVAMGEKRRASSDTIVVGDLRTPNSFKSLLPTLLSPEIGGGNPFNQALGAWLRAHGCEGLIYPSARTNWASTVEGGVVTAHSGWNFVDFRATEAPDYSQHFGHVLEWTVYLGEKYASLLQQGPADSFSIETVGLSNQNYARFNCHAHHSRQGSRPNLFDLTRGYVSVLDLDLRDEDLLQKRP